MGERESEWGRGEKRGRKGRGLKRKGVEWKKVEEWQGREAISSEKRGEMKGRKGTEVVREVASRTDYCKRVEGMGGDQQRRERSDSDERRVSVGTRM